MTSPSPIDASRTGTRPPVDEVMSNAMEAGPPSLRRRVVRRAAVVALGLLLAVHSAGLVMDSGVLFLGTVLVSLPVLALLNIGTRGMFELRPAALDERMRTERLRFHEMGYRLDLGVLLAMVVGVGSVASADASARLAFVIVEAGVIIIALAPRLAGAWLLPDEPDLAADEAVATNGQSQVAAGSVWRSLWKALTCSHLLRADWRSPEGRRTLWLFLVCGLGGGVFGFTAAVASSR